MGRLGAAAREGADEVTATCADIASALGDRWGVNETHGEELPPFSESSKRQI